MNLVSTMIWTVVQVFILLVSFWFFIYGVRNIFERRYFAMVFIVFAFLGVWGVVNSFLNITGGHTF